MARKQYFLIVDTETTMDDLVADFGAIVVDRKGNIHNQCGVLINGIYTDMEQHPLFHTFDPEDVLWCKANLKKRYDRYNAMVQNGQRMIATVSAINGWLAKVNAKYAPVLTAYNLAFDRNKCQNTGIDLAMFEQSFCLWYAAFTKIGTTKNYRNFVLQTHAFNPPTKLRNMSYKTNAETMCRFVLNNPTLEDEPHTSLEDARDYELPILLDILKRSRKREYLDPVPFDWTKVQVKDWFTAL